MPEPKRLTGEELADIEWAWTKLLPPSDDDSAASFYLRRLLGHIAILDAENVALHGLVRELTASEKAGIDDSGVYAECICCGALAMTNLWRDVTHAPDCPIVRGRALVQP